MLKKRIWITGVVLAIILCIALVFVILNTYRITAEIVNVTGTRDTIKGLSITGEFSFDKRDDVDYISGYVARRKVDLPSVPKSTAYALYKTKRTLREKFSFPKNAGLCINTEVYGETPFGLCDDNLVRTVGDKVYFYTRTGEDNWGTGGVYEIGQEFGSRETITPQNLAPIDLKEGKCQIVGFEANANCLAVFTWYESKYQCHIYTPDGVKTAVVDLYQVNADNSISSTNYSERNYPATLISGDYLYYYKEFRFIINLKTIERMPYQPQGDLIYPGSLFFATEANGNLILMKDFNGALVIEAYQGETCVYSGKADISNMKNIKIEFEGTEIS